MYSKYIFDIFISIEDISKYTQVYIMVKYIIKISCTSERELAYNNRIIKQNNIPKDTLEDLIYEFNC